MFHNINQLKDQFKTETTHIFSASLQIWDSRQNDGLSKIQNQICQQTLDFDDTIDIAKATNEGIIKEKYLPQDAVHKIAREEAAKQCKDTLKD